MSSNWDKELAKIEKQIQSLPDEALLPAKSTGAPAAQAGVSAAPTRTTTSWGVALRLLLAVALGVGMYFWPYPSRCGAGLVGYLAAAGVLVSAGVWSAVSAWRHRSPKAHVVSLLVTLWGGGLAAVEILPKIGYAIPTEAHPAAWFCE